MNFMAHLYLSGDNDEVKTGNFLGDFCTSREIQQLPDQMQKGIILHREIDAFTDSSEEFAQLVAMLRPTQGKYSPVVADIVWDHFLASSEYYFQEGELESFAAACYRTLLMHKAYLPPKAKRFLTFAVEVDVFTAYASMSGVQKVFIGMSRRASFQNNMANAAIDLEINYNEFEVLFHTFFPKLIAHCDPVKEKLFEK